MGNTYDLFLNLLILLELNKNWYEISLCLDLMLKHNNTGFWIHENLLQVCNYFLLYFLMLTPRRAVSNGLKEIIFISLKTGIFTLQAYFLGKPSLQKVISMTCKKKTIIFQKVMTLKFGFHHVISSIVKTSCFYLRK